MAPKEPNKRKITGHGRTWLPDREDHGDNKHKIAASNTQNKRELATA